MLLFANPHTLSPQNLLGETTLIVQAGSETDAENKDSYIALCLILFHIIIYLLLFHNIIPLFKLKSSVTNILMLTLYNLVFRAKIQHKYFIK